MSLLDRRRLPLTVLLVAAVVVQLLVLYLPETPEAPGGVDVPAGDKAVHLAVFGAVTWAGLAAGLRRGPVVGYGVVQAVVSEVVQHVLLPHRSGDPVDAVADLVGVVLALLVFTAWRSRSGRGRSDPARSARR